MDIQASVRVHESQSSTTVHSSSTVQHSSEIAYFCFTQLSHVRGTPIEYGQYLWHSLKQISSPWPVSPACEDNCSRHINCPVLQSSICHQVPECPLVFQTPAVEPYGVGCKSVQTALALYTTVTRMITALDEINFNCWLYFDKWRAVKTRLHVD